jgi:hypothetical protein
LPAWLGRREGRKGVSRESDTYLAVTDVNDKPSEEDDVFLITS